jgi:hypothetical protein
VTKQIRSWLAAVALALAVAVGGSVYVWGQANQSAQVIAVASSVPSPVVSSDDASPTPVPTPTPVVTPTPTPSVTPRQTPSPTAVASKPATTAPKATPRPSPSPTPTVKVPKVRPPISSLHISNSYLARHGARRATWDNVIDSGSTLPAVTSGCARSWRSSGKDAKLNWSSASYLCLSSLSGRGYKPQGVGGSATAEGYTIGRKLASDRNLILTSWYSEANESGLLASNRAGGSVTRLVVMDMDQRRYAKVELVRPGGNNGFRSIDSHGSGLVWAGQYIYSSSRSVLWMYNADDIVKVRGHYVLPAIARWTVRGSGGMSSISIDRSSTPSRLNAINYSKGGQAFIQSFDLASNGLLASNGRSAKHDLSLRNSYGEKGRVVHSVRSVVVDGSSFQGVASVGPYGFANSSALHVGGRVVDAMVVLKSGRVIERFQMPRGNGESIYLDYLRGTFVSITEHGSQFLYRLPLQHVTEQAER